MVFNISFLARWQLEVVINLVTRKLCHALAWIRIDMQTVLKIYAVMLESGSHEFTTHIGKHMHRYNESLYRTCINL